MPVSIETRRFQNQAVHLIKESWLAGYTSYCGLRERDEIWTEANLEVTCRFCQKRLLDLYWLPRLLDRPAAAS